MKKLLFSALFVLIFAIGWLPSASAAAAGVTQKDGLPGGVLIFEMTIDGQKYINYPLNWHQYEGNWYYFKMGSQGVPYKGWLNDKGSRYFLDQNGVMKTGWLYQGGNWYFLNGSGNMRMGWVMDRGIWYFLDRSSGVMATGWKYIDGKWYFFNQQGSMKTGWIQTGSKWYYLEGSGAMRTGWLKSGATWYYLDPNGAMKTGWKQIGQDWFYLNPDGKMRTGWLQSGGNWYYFNDYGNMRTGALAIQEGEKYYYFDESGAMIKGWVMINYRWHYYYGDGRTAKNMTVDGRYVGEDWYWIPNNPYFDQLTAVFKENHLEAIEQSDTVIVLIRNGKQFGSIEAGYIDIEASSAHFGRYIAAAMGHPATYEELYEYTNLALENQTTYTFPDWKVQYDSATDHIRFYW
ncbi:hypothetical protein QNH39_25155 [Neobacillus novalis]|uniref:Uncharacterized protein n=1 Tax=Neobacillus novalis TaxID=220687 RepID=A0AA95MKY2_9BACI|nr:hypothetical protein [Neobacillus novalis]WHY85849.1 hypothetical protein QNH39_25155 [Neobacillus novalis]